MTTEQEIVNKATQFRIGCYFDARARRDGLPFIRFLKNGQCLAEFYDTADALNWFPKIDSPDAAGKSIQSSANI